MPALGLLLAVILSLLSACGAVPGLGDVRSDPGASERTGTAALAGALATEPRASDAVASAPPSTVRPEAELFPTAPSSAESGAEDRADAELDSTETYVDPGGRFTLGYGSLWRRTETPSAEGPVEWLLRLERGQPDRPAVPGARRPPNGVRFDVGIASVPSGTDLPEWAEASLPIDSSAMSVTADGVQMTVGPDRLRAVVREGQILPYYGRWREWLMPVPADPNQVFVLRAASYGDDELMGMVHAKLIVAAFRPYVVPE